MHGDVADVQPLAGTIIHQRARALDDQLENPLDPGLAGQRPADRKLLDSWDDMVSTLYDQDDAATADPLLARSVRIDLALAKETFGDPLTLDFAGVYRQYHACLMRTLLVGAPIARQHALYAACREALLAWLTDICRTDDGRWSDERVIVFTEYRDTQKWLVDLLLATRKKHDVEHGVVAVPGRVDNLAGTLLHAPNLPPKWLALTSRDSLQRALDLPITLANDGFPMPPYMNDVLGATASGRPRCAYPDLNARYCDGDQPKPVGTMLFNPELGDVLEEVRDGGADAFYDPDGTIAPAIARSPRDTRARAACSLMPSRPMCHASPSCSSMRPNTSPYSAASIWSRRCNVERTRASRSCRAWCVPPRPWVSTSDDRSSARRRSTSRRS